MNTRRTAPHAYRAPSRLPALAMAALMTVSLLMGIDTLARNDEPAMKVAARVTTLAHRPA